MEELRNELAKRDQELQTMNAKMKAFEDKQHNSESHIRVLKDSLRAKEEHYNMLLAEMDVLRRNHDERNKLFEKKSYQQTLAQFGAGGSRPNMQQAEYIQQEMQDLLDIRDKKIGDLQHRIMQIEGLLAERNAQLERARMRLEHSSGAGSQHHVADAGFLNHLEETLNEREKQISLLHNQRDRLDRELNEERDLHERSIKEYKMKLNSVKFEMDKLQVS